jgi:hypothetical protein
MLTKTTSEATEVHTWNRRNFGFLEYLGALYFHHQIVAKPVPKFETNLKKFFFRNVAHLDHVP